MTAMDSDFNAKHPRRRGKFTQTTRSDPGAVIAGEVARTGAELVEGDLIDMRRMVADFPDDFDTDVAEQAELDRWACVFDNPKVEYGFVDIDTDHGIFTVPDDYQVPTVPGAGLQ